MRPYLTLFIYIFFSASLYCQSQNQSGKFVILHTNDIHSNITGFSPELEYTPCSINDDNTVAGFSRIATIIKNEKELNPVNTLIVDAGDFLMGTLFHVLEPETGFQLNLMKKIGYDIVSIGNHEFDFGPSTLAKIINSGINNGEIPGITLSNIKFNDKSPDDDELEKLYENNTVKQYAVFEKAGFKIGVFGILGKDAYEVAPNSKPLIIENRIKTAKKIVKILRKDEKVDFIICLSHSGIYKDKKGRWNGEDVELAKKVKGIGLIVGGHTHTGLYEPVWVNGTPIVQAGSQGKNIGRFEIDINDKDNITFLNYKLIKIDDNIYGDCDIDNIIKKQIEKIDDEFLIPKGMEYNKPIVETNYELICDEYGDLAQSNLGPLLADAIYYYVNEYSEIETDISMIAAGVIRDKVRTGDMGVQTVQDIFRVVSLGEGDDGIPGYPLANVYLTGKELKNVLELLLIASAKYPSLYCFFGNVEVYYDSSKGFLKKIKQIKVGDEYIDFLRKNEKLYSITADSYMLEFVGKINKMTLGLIKIKPKDSEGNIITDNKKTWIDFDKEKNGIQEGKEWIAVINYLETFEDTNDNGIPDLPEYYSIPRLRLIDIVPTVK